MVLHLQDKKVEKHKFLRIYIITNTSHDPPKIDSGPTSGQPIIEKRCTNDKYGGRFFGF